MLVFREEPLPEPVLEESGLPLQTLAKEYKVLWSEATIDDLLTQTDLPYVDAKPTPGKA